MWLRSILTLGAALALVTLGCETRGSDADSAGADDTSGTDGGSDGADGGSDDTDTPPIDTEAPAEGLLVFEGAPPTNILMVSVDTLRRDYTSRYDPEDGDFTPFLEELMSQSVVLDEHRSCSNWTYAAVLCTILGQDNLDTGWVPTRGFAGTGEPPGPVPDGLVTLANFLGGAGYVSGLMSTNPFLGGAEYNQTSFYDTIQVLSDGPADEVSTGALQILDGLLGEGAPWMMHVHYFDPHSPYEPPDSYRKALKGLPPIDYDLTTVAGETELYNDFATLDGVELDLIKQHIRVLYGGEIRFWDDQLRLLWGELEARGALDDTLVVFWSDHGEQFFEHGGFTHGQTLNAEETRGVAFFWAKNLTPGVWSDRTTHRDLAPTTMAALGFAPGEGMTGIRIGDDPTPEDRFTLAHAASLIRQTLDYGDKRLVYTWTGQLEVYDVAADPYETTDLFQSGDPEIQALWKRLLPEIERMNTLFPEETYIVPDL